MNITATMKGEFEKGCFRSPCTNMVSDWYNHSNRKYYCRSCANLINKFAHEFKKKHGYSLCVKHTEPKNK